MRGQHEARRRQKGSVNKLLTDPFWTLPMVRPFNKPEQCENLLVSGFVRMQATVSTILRRFDHCARLPHPGECLVQASTQQLTHPAELYQ
jgi:hypothetical protein